MLFLAVLHMYVCVCVYQGGGSNLDVKASCVRVSFVCPVSQLVAPVPSGVLFEYLCILIRFYIKGAGVARRYPPTNKFSSTRN